MKYDREEAYLREKLTDGLHPADVDLWPAVAEHLPDARPARHWRRALCFLRCSAAPATPPNNAPREILAPTYI